MKKKILVSLGIVFLLTFCAFSVKAAASLVLNVNPFVLNHRTTFSDLTYNYKHSFVNMRVDSYTQSVFSDRTALFVSGYRTNTFGIAKQIDIRIPVSGTGQYYKKLLNLGSGNGYFTANNRENY